MAQRHPFRFGVINEQPLPREAWLARVRRAEELGYSTFLLRDHLVSDAFGPQYGPIAALATAAAVTTRLRVGTMVIDNDFRHPAILAKEIATVAALSGGRIELGIGAGWLRAEYERAGIVYDPAAERIDRLEEALAVIEGLWRGGPFSFAGKHYHIDGLEPFPCVDGASRPPILVGAGKPRMLRLAGRAADIVGILTSSVASGTMVADPAERTRAAVVRKLGWVREGAGERFASIELSMIPSFVITNHREAAASAIARERGWDGYDAADVLEMPSMLIGSYEEVIALLVQCREEYGFSYVVVSDGQMEELAPVVCALSGT